MFSHRRPPFRPTKGGYLRRFLVTAAVGQLGIRPTKAWSSPRHHGLIFLALETKSPQSRTMTPDDHGVGVEADHLSTQHPSPSSIDMLCPCKTRGHNTKYGRVLSGSTGSVFKTPGKNACPLDIYPC